MIAAMPKTWSEHLGCWSVIFALSIPVPAVPQQTKLAPANAGAFLEAEHAVRHEFLQRYSLSDQAMATMGPQTTKNRAVMQLLKTLDQLPDDEKFGTVFAYVMRGKVEAKKTTAAPPTYWQRQLGELMKALPFGDNAANAYIAQNETRASQENAEAPNRLAQERLQNFKTLVVGYRIATGAEFDQADPLEKTRLILSTFSKLQGDIGLPCPFSIFLLDMDAAQAGDADNPPVTRDVVGRLLGKSSTDYQHYPEYSREQKSVALKHAYLHLLEGAQKVAAAPSFENLHDYLPMAGMSANRGSWSVQEETGNAHPFTEIMRATFGDTELQKFSHEAEGTEKDAERVAVILLWAQYRMGSSGWMIG